MSRKKLPGGGWEDVHDLDLRPAEINNDIMRRFVPVATIEPVPAAALDDPKPERRLPIRAIVDVPESELTTPRALTVVPPAAAKRGDHCLKGHPLSGDNLYIIPSTGQRVCRTCKKARQANYRAEYVKPQPEPRALFDAAAVRKAEEAADAISATPKRDQRPTPATAAVELVPDSTPPEEPSPGPWRPDELAVASAVHADELWDAKAERWVDAPPLIRAAIDWLLEHGPTWSQREAELWLRMLTSAVDLDYPTAA